MIRKILVVSIAALCCLLIGLLVIFFYINVSINKKNSILSFIPAETQFILRVKETSATTNNFFSNKIVKDIFNFNEVGSTWLLIDSITSRNYKTSEVLLKNTSYLCIDSLGKYLILIDLNQKTNEHFIDQFLVNSTSLRKIEKYKEGYKAFYPTADKPVFYFVKQNVFAISPDSKLILSSLQHGQTEKSEKKIAEWDTQTQSKLAIWSLNGTYQKIFKEFGAENFMTDLNPSCIVSTSMDLVPDESGLQVKAVLNIDTSNAELSVFNPNSKEQSTYFYEADSGIWSNRFYSLQTRDSINKFQPISFVYSAFLDSASIPSFLLVSQSPIALSQFQMVSQDTSVQMISMADDNIKQIAVFDHRMFKKILPLVPFNMDTAKLFATIRNGYLFIGNSTETILTYASVYPGKNFIKKKLEASVIIFHSAIKVASGPYVLEYNYQFTSKSTISFTSEIKPIIDNN